VDIDGAGAEVVEDQVFLDLANAANRALKGLLDENALLRVDDLIVGFFQLAVNLDILDVQNRIVRESLLESPKLTILQAEK
jgi:hypothetical protein